MSTITISPNAHTYADPTTGETYLEAATSILFEMSADMHQLPTHRAIATEYEQHTLVASIDALEVAYLHALVALAEGNHTALLQAMEALTGAVSEVTTLLATY